MVLMHLFSTPSALGQEIIRSQTGHAHPQRYQRVSPTCFQKGCPTAETFMLDASEAARYSSTGRLLDDKTVHVWSSHLSGPCLPHSVVLTNHLAVSLIIVRFHPCLFMCHLGVSGLQRNGALARALCQLQHQQRTSLCLCNLSSRVSGRADGLVSRLCNMFCWSLQQRIIWLLWSYHWETGSLKPVRSYLGSRELNVTRL